MWRCSGVVLVAGLALLCGLPAGSCAVTAEEVIPESGSVIYDVVGSPNVHLFCDVRNNGSAVLVNWFKQSPEDREEDRSPDAIVNDDTFTLSGDVVEGFSLNTNLTISSLTEDLDDVIIFCGLVEFVANFTLRIYFPPTLSDRGNITKRENEQLSLDISEPDSRPAFPFPSDVMWRRDGVELVNISDTRVFGYPSIFIGSVLQSDAGPYTLTATNYQPDGSLVGTDTGYFTLNVLFGAGLDAADPGSVAVLEGDSVTLECGTDLTGNPIPTVVWRDNNGSEVSPGGRFTLSSGREVVSITVDSTNRTDAGNWTCTVQVYENGTGSLTVGGPVEVSVQLVVVVAPSAPEDVAVEQVGSTWISLSWFQSTRGIPPLTRHMILVMGGGENRSVSEESSEMAANVTGLLPGTEYMFRIVAVSEFRGVQAPSPPSDSVPGTTETSVPAPVCSETPRADDDRLVVSWTYTHTGGLDITSVDVFFNPDTSPEMRQAFSSVPGAVVEDVLSEEREDSIPLPEAGLHYQFTVRAENRVGASEVDCPVTRLDTGIPSRPDPPTVDSGSGSVVVMVTTQHSGVRDNAVDEFRFILKIRNAADPSQDPIQRNESVPGCITGACSASVSLSSEDGLVEGVSYIVEVGAVNRYGESAVSGNSEPFIFGSAGTGGGENTDSSAAGAIAGGVVGGVVIVALTALIIILIVVIFLKMKNASYDLKGRGGGGGHGVNVEEVDLGEELTMVSVDPDKELHYAELEHFQKPSTPSHNNDIMMDTKMADEPVQYATIQEIKKKKPSTNGLGEGGEVKEGEGEGEKEGGEGDKAQTSSTFV